MNRRLLFAIAALFVSAASATANAAQLDDKSGDVHLDAAVLAEGFEDDVSVTKFRGATLGLVEWDYEIAKPVATATRSEDEGALEGSGTLKVAQGKSFVLEDPRLAALRDKRFTVSVWARADGAGPIAFVAYAKPGVLSLTGVRLVPTGRATSDGWFELSSGPLEGNVLNIDVRAIVLGGSKSKGSVSFDALEVATVDGAALESKTCTERNVDAVCGAEGDCVYGRCIPSNTIWGALPAREIRLAALKRWIAYAAHWMGDRAAAARAERDFAPAALALAAAKSPRAFYGGLVKLVNELRNGHTSLGLPQYSSFLATSLWPSASGVGGCFNLIVDDRAGGQTAFAVQSVPDPTPASGVSLQPGDLLLSVDGGDVKTWLDLVWPVAGHPTNDPRAEPARIANHMADLLSRKASRFTIARCKPGTDCSPANRTSIEIDLTKDEYVAHQGTFAAHECSPRLVNAVSTAKPSKGGNDVVYSTTVGDTTLIQFDGFVGGESWSDAMTNALTNASTKVVVDARVGNGGSGDLVDTMVRALLANDQRWGQVLVPRGRWDNPDPDWLVPEINACYDATSRSPFCIITNAHFASQSGVAGNKRVAWLNTLDLSANDFAPRALQGRAGFRIFAPHPTEGAFGGVMNLPPLLPGWTGGSIQIQDTRFVTSMTDVATARWESGHGVEPDEVVLQKLSDLLQGKDTLLDRARVWLDE